MKSQYVAYLILQFTNKITALKPVPCPYSTKLSSFPKIHLRRRAERKKQKGDLSWGHREKNPIDFLKISVLISKG